MSEIRVCDNCKHHNSINYLECEQCGFDLSFVIPVEENELVKNSTGELIDSSKSLETDNTLSDNLILVSIDKQIVIPITNELLIGRDGVHGDYFEKSNFVSRKHAIFYLEDECVFVFDASTNGTYINDKQIPKLTRIPINSSDKIAFADVVFEVKNADR